MSATVAISIRPLSSALGASVEGIDLNRPVPDAVRKEIYAAWLRHLILVFANQRDMTIESQIAFSRIFGELDSSTLSNKTLPGHPEIYVIGVDIPESRLPALLGALATGGVYAVACWLIGSWLKMLPEKLSTGFIRAKLSRARPA